MKHSEFIQTTVTLSPAIAGITPNVGALRPIVEAGLGVNWGSYVNKNRQHVGFSAHYDFALLWEQNMMRQTVGLLANNAIGYSNPIGSLYLHGLTVDARLDF